MGIKQPSANTRIFICIGFLTILTVLYTLSLVGCVSNSPGVPGIYLVKLSDTTTNATVQVGYFGLCAGDNGRWSCQPTFGTDFNTTLTNFDFRATTVGLDASSASGFRTSSAAAQNNVDAIDALTHSVSLRSLLLLGHDIQQKIIVFVPLLIGGILFLASFCALLAWALLSGKKPDQADKAKKASFMLTTYSVAGAVGAAAAVTMASSALRFAGTSLANSSSSVQAVGGQALQALQWLIVVFTMLWHLTAAVMLKEGGAA